MQVNVAPFDVRQGNFVGAGVNTVTRSGTNKFRGSVYHQFRNDELGRHRGEGPAPSTPAPSSSATPAAGLGGPIVKNRLFFFGNYEDETLTQPGTTFRANTGGETGRRQRDARARVGPRQR